MVCALVIFCNFAAQSSEDNSFNITVKSNPTTGYHWELSDESYGVELVNHTFVSDNPALTGSGGADTFVFKVLQNAKDNYYAKIVLIAPDGSIVNSTDSNNLN
ncbi:MAG: protease inhibitor I42 family protein [archaeon]|nr:protease inhibitor I42 family protein [archaeon]